MNTHRRWFALWLALAGCTARGQTVTITEPDVVTADDDASTTLPDAQVPFDVRLPTDVQFPTDAQVPGDVQFPTDVQFPSDNPFVVDVPRDTGVRDTGARDTGVPRDAGTPDVGPVTVLAGGPCASDDDCGTELQCFDNLVGGGWCSAGCDNDPSASFEQSECGGAGSTCLRRRSATTTVAEASFCTRTCEPSASSERTGACRAGHVCTYFWLSQPVGETETAGCFPFCASDSQCVGVPVRDGTTGEVVPGMMASRCNTRTGFCQVAPVDTALLADGLACNPQTVASTMRPVCRGVCFGISSAHPEQGICGSYINTAVSPTCPDDATMQPLTPGDDNLAVCVFKNCAHNSDCGAGLRCVYPETTTGGTTTVVMTAQSTCRYATTMQPTGIP